MFSVSLKPQRIATVLILFCGLLCTTGSALAAATTPEKNDYEQLNLFSDVLSLVQKNYVEPVTMQQMVYAAITGMLQELDPHSEFMPPEMFKEMEIETKGEFNGLGIEISVKDHQIIVIAPIADTPAERAGIKAGDQIVKIDGQLLKNLSISEAVQRLRGDKGSRISLAVLRDPHQPPLEFTLTRETIRIDSIKQQFHPPDLGYVRISQFQERSAEDLRTALHTLTRQANGKLAGLVIDLRNNPGGLLDQAVKVADLFLDAGEIVSTRGRQPEDNVVYTATAHGVEPRYPIIILINSGSASAAEIVAGALQDQQRALVLGTRSFGKGSVQSVIELSDQSGLRLTTARYYTPNGTSIQARGITPDLLIEQGQWQAEQSTPQLREKDLDKHIETPDNEPALAPSPSATADTTSTTSQPEQDYQLHYALDLLRGWQRLAQRNNSQ